MDEERKPEEKRQNFRRAGNANGAFTFRLLACGIVLYWLWDVVSAYIKGGPDAPSLGVLIFAIIAMGGGAIGVGLLAYKTYKLDKARAEMSEEEIAAVEALRAEDKEDAPEEASEDAPEEAPALPETEDDKP